MFKAVLFALALACAAPAFAQESELDRLRDEIRQLKRSHDERMQALEKRLTEAEARAGKAGQGAVEAHPAPQAQGPAPARMPARSGESAFNPAISLILQGTYARTSQDPKNFAISGFVPSGGEVAPARRRFGLGESEIVMSASVDPYFRGTAILALTRDNEAEVEEAYVQTLALPGGFTLKAGRFLSGIGYQNETHRHAWDFQDASLPYKAFLGGRYRHDGVQLRWVAPTPFYLALGGELGSGESFPGSDQNKNGAGSAALFGHVGGDIGTSYAWRAGLSRLRASARDRSHEGLDALGNPVTNSFTGATRLWVVDGILKWAPIGNATRIHVKLQGEYFRANQDGTLTYNDTAQAAPQFGVPLTDYFRTAQSGWYLQGVYQFMPRWRAGYRHDELRYGTVGNGIVANALGPSAADFAVLARHHPTRNTAMLDYSPSEFSRIRVQFASDNSRQGVTDRQMFLQYIHSLGAHGAHRF